MKRLLILLFFISLMMPPCHEPGTSLAQQCEVDSTQLARLSPAIVGGGVPVAAGATNYTQLASCVGAWYMNGTTTETDRSASGYTLAVSAGDTISSSASVPTGYAGASRIFTYADSEHLFIADGSCPALDINGANANITIVAWVNATTANDYTWAVTKWADSNKQYRIGVNGTTSGHYQVFGQLSASSADGGNSDNIDGDTETLDTGVWYHIALVYNDIDMRLYVNGVLDATVAKTDGIYNGTGHFAIGSETSGGDGFNGLIDEVAIFNTALSATQILEIYTSGISGNKGGSD